MISREILAGSSFQTVQLGEIVDFLDSKRRPVKEADRRVGAYPYYGANGQQGTIDGYIFDEPLVLLAEDGGFFDQPDRGIAYRIDGKTWVNNHAHVLRAGPKIDTGYLRRVLENYDVSPFVTGTTRAKLTKAGAERIEIPLPKLHEQLRIAAILDQADALRRARRFTIDRLDDLAQSIFSEMFGDVVANSKGWRSGKQLGEIAEIVSGVTKGRKLRGERMREVPYLAVINVQDRALKLGTVKRIYATEEEISRYALKLGDLLLTEGGDPDKLGRGTLWNGELPECIYQNHIFRVRLNSEEINPVFLNWLVGSPRGKRYFLRSAKQTTGIASINKGQLKAFPLLIPPVDIQAKFDTRIRFLSAQRRCMAAHLAKLDVLFASLQQRTFCGELMINNVKKVATLRRVG